MAEPRKVNSLQEACTWLQEHAGTPIEVNKPGSEPKVVFTQDEIVDYYKE